MVERGRTWSDREIAVSLAKWSDETIQRQLCEAVHVVPFRAIADMQAEIWLSFYFAPTRDSSRQVCVVPLSDPNSPSLHACSSHAV